MNILSPFFSHKSTLSGSLQCPICRKPTPIKYIENVGPYIKRYKCIQCNLTFRYDRTPQGHWGERGSVKGTVGKPYHSFTRGLKIIHPKQEK